MAIRGQIFPRHNIHSRCLEELRTEFDRLVFLKWQTIAKYGQGNEVREARNDGRDERNEIAQRSEAKRTDRDDDGPVRN